MKVSLHEADIVFDVVAAMDTYRIDKSSKPIRDRWMVWLERGKKKNPDFGSGCKFVGPLGSVMSSC